MSTHSAFMHNFLRLNEHRDTGSDSYVDDSPVTLSASGSDALKGYYKKETGIAASTTTTYDLVGSLTDKDGDTINFDKVHIIKIRNLGAYPLEFGPGANAFGVLSGTEGFFKTSTTLIIVPPNSERVLHSKAGVSATGGSADELKVVTVSSSSSNTWQIWIAGVDNA